MGFKTTHAVNLCRMSYPKRTPGHGQPSMTLLHALVVKDVLALGASRRQVFFLGSAADLAQGAPPARPVVERGRRGRGRQVFLVEAERMVGFAADAAKEQLFATGRTAQEAEGVDGQRRGGDDDGHAALLDGRRIVLLPVVHGPLVRLPAAQAAVERLLGQGHRFLALGRLLLLSGRRRAQPDLQKVLDRFSPGVLAARQPRLLGSRGGLAVAVGGRVGVLVLKHDVGAVRVPVDVRVRVPERIVERGQLDLLEAAGLILRVDPPKPSLSEALIVLDEGLVQTQVVPDGVLPPLLVHRGVKGKHAGDEVVNHLQRRLSSGRILQRHRDQRPVRQPRSHVLVLHLRDVDRFRANQRRLGLFFRLGNRRQQLGFDHVDRLFDVGSCNGF